MKRLMSGFEFSPQWDITDAIESLAELRLMMEELEEFGTLSQGMPDELEPPWQNDLYRRFQRILGSQSPPHIIEGYIKRLVDSRHRWDWPHTPDDISHRFGEFEYVKDKGHPLLKIGDLENDPKWISMRKRWHLGDRTLNGTSLPQLQEDLKPYRRIGRWCEEIFVADRYILDPDQGRNKYHKFNDLGKILATLSVLNKNGQRIINIAVYVSETKQKNLLNQSADAWVNMESELHQAVTTGAGLNKKDSRRVSLHLHVTKSPKIVPHPRLLVLKKGSSAPGFTIDNGFTFRNTAGPWTFMKDLSPQLNLWQRSCSPEPGTVS